MSAAEPHSLKFQGKAFTAPASTVAINRDERLALAIIPGNPFAYGDDRLRYAMSEEAVDLSLVRTGRCPALTEHLPYLHNLIGVVAAAAVENGELRALVRFAPTTAGNEVWSLIEAGLPVSLSAGGTVVAAEWEGQGTALATRWRLREISACVMGRDEGAHMRALEASENAADLVGRMTVDDAAKAAVRARLRLDDWALWSRTAAPRLARKLGVDLDAAEGALTELVLDRITEFVEALA